MTSKEIIRRVIQHDHPPRIGLDFLPGNPSDFCKIPPARLIHPEYDAYGQWGRDPNLLEKSPGFSGEVKMTVFGNLFGRFDQKTQGECIKGALQDGWEVFQSYRLPEPDSQYYQELREKHLENSDKFVLGGLPLAVFSPLRDARRMDNALMDLRLEPGHVHEFLGKAVSLIESIITQAAGCGFDGFIIYDDLGTQRSLFLSPGTFREMLKPWYKRVADCIHSYGKFFFMHSCGMVADIIGDLIEAGVDVFQFDQPELAGSQYLASRYGNQAAFYCPVDIQKTMATGDRDAIEKGALQMVREFQKYGGSLIAMDYGNWQDIGVLPQWQQWARDVILAHMAIPEDD